MTTMKTLLFIGSALHFCILLASAVAPFAADWKSNLAPLPRLLRQMFWVYGGFIVLVIVGFGTLSIGHVDQIAAGVPLARGLAAFIAAFWLARLTVQLFVFDAKPFLTHWFLKTGYHGLTFVFIYLAAVFGCAALGLGLAGRP